MNASEKMAVENVEWRCTKMHASASWKYFTERSTKHLTIGFTTFLTNITPLLEYTSPVWYGCQGLSNRIS